MKRLHDSPYLLNSYLDQFQELVISRGANFKELCELADLTVADVSGPTALIPFDRFVAILELAAEKLDLDDVALKLANRQSIRILGPVSLMIVRCASIKEALEKIVSSLHLLVSGITIRFSLSQETFTVHVDVDLPILQKKEQFHDYLIASIVVTLRQLYGASFPITSCELIEFDPGKNKTEKLFDFLGCYPRFGNPQIRLSMGSSILEAKPNTDAVSFFNDHGNIRLARREVERSVRDALISGMMTGNTRIEYVSSLLGYSERTLRRRLKELSLSFSDILDATRMAQANKYLQSSHYRLCDIAMLLGYANQSAFTRSYVRCCGITPSQFRNRLA